MIRKLWRLQTLATELGMTVKTLAKRLETLDPDRTEENNRGTDRYYSMVRVLDHLQGNTLGSDGKKLDLSAERARLAAEQADKTALANAVQRGNLVEVPTVARVWGELMMGIKSRMLGLPTKMASELATLTSADEIKSRLTEEIHDLLTEATAFDPGDGTLRSPIVDEEDAPDPDASPKVNGKRMGGPDQEVKPRKQRRTRSVEN